MSKEQTPIEWKLKNIIAVELMDLSIMDEVVEHKTNEIYKGVISILNAKVLEALEKEFSKVAVFDKNRKSEIGKYYFKKEVKPRYEK